jgi:predicted permease
MVKSPGFSAVAVASLAIGIGANTAVYGVVRFALLDPLPVERPEELRLVYWSGPEGIRISQYNSGDGTDPATGRSLRSNYSYPGYEALRELQLEGEVCGFNFIPQLGVSVDGRPAASAGALMVSGNWFDVVRPSIALGRGINEADDAPAAPPVAVLTHGFWTRVLGADPGVLGKAAIIDGTAFTVVGVTGSGFRGLSTGGNHTPLTDVIVALSAQPLVWSRGAGPWFGDLNRMWIRAMMRLPPGTDGSLVTTPMSTALRRSLAEAGLVDGDGAAEVQVFLRPGERGIDGLSSRAEQPLMILSAVVVLVLLIACVNVAGLMLARGVARQAEVSVRGALGASRLRLLRQLLVESGVLALAGGAMGLLLAYGAMPVVNAMVGTAFGAQTPDVPIDLGSLGLTLAICCAVAILVGALPALRLTGVDGVSHLHRRAGGSGAARQTLGRVLLAVQIGVSVPLVVGAGLLLRTVHDLGRVELGFDAGGLVVFRVEPGATVDPEQRAALSGRLLERLEAIPGVLSATFVENVLLSGWISNNVALIDGQARAIHMNAVGSRFFETMDIPIVAGRPISARDDAGAPRAVVINEAAARRYFGEGSPLGRRFTYGRSEAEVVGVARDSKYDSLRADVPPTLFDSYLQRTAGWVPNVVVRTAAPLAGPERQIRDAVAEVGPDLPVAEVRTQRDVLARSIGRELLVTRLLAAFGGFALALATIGLYGLTSYTVSRSTSEIGIRMALGAERRHVQWMVLRTVMLTTAAGLLLGVPAALAASPVLEALLYGVGPRDLPAVAAATAATLAVALLAGLLPARRAARLDPLAALRAD